MKYTKLGNSELEVSRVCMGCMGFGDAGNGQHSWTLDEEHSRQIIRRGLELGINFFDTAIAYQSGTSEQYLGRALRDFARRDEVVWRRNSCPARRKRSKRASPGSSILRSSWIPASEIWEWTMWICIFIICGITRRRFMTSWTV